MDQNFGGKSAGSSEEKMDENDSVLKDFYAGEICYLWKSQPSDSATCDVILSEAKAQIGNFLADNDLSTFFDLEENGNLKVDRFAIILSSISLFYIEMDTQIEISQDQALELIKDESTIIQNLKAFKDGLFKFGRIVSFHNGVTH